MKPGDRDKLGRRFNIKPKDCGTCGTRFQPTSGFQRFCSRSCQLEQEKTERICQHCGDVFLRAKWEWRKYCSPRCANTSNAQKRKGKRGQFGSGKPKYPRVAVCEHCGQKFMQQTHRAHFCSRQCGQAAGVEKRKQTLGTIPTWSLKTKGEELCRNCGRVATHLHHIVPRSKSREGKRDVENNGLPLCSDCHRGWHDHRLTIYRPRLRANEITRAIELTGELWVENNYPYTPDQELRRRVAISEGDDPENEWRYCAEGRDGDRVAYEEAQQGALQTLLETEQAGRNF